MLLIRRRPLGQGNPGQESPPSVIPPLVSLTSPIAGQTFVVPTSVNVVATATTPDGSGIEKIELFANGSLFATVTTSDIDVALASNGASAVKSSEHASGRFPATSALNDNDRGINWGNGGGWNSNGAPSVGSPEYVGAIFDATYDVKSFAFVTLQDNNGTNPVTDTLTFTQDGVIDGSMEYTTNGGSSWSNVTSFTGNNLVRRTYTPGAPRSCNGFRVPVTKAGTAHGDFARIVALHAHVDNAGASSFRATLTQNTTGTIALTAKAYANNGQSTISAPISLTFNGAPPPPQPPPPQPPGPTLTGARLNLGRAASHLYVDTAIVSDAQGNIAGIPGYGITAGWVHAGGDWRDQNNVSQGSAAWGATNITLAANQPFKIQTSAAMVALVEKLRLDPTGIYLYTPNYSGGNQLKISNDPATNVKLVVTNTAGVTFTLNPTIQVTLYSGGDANAGAGQSFLPQAVKHDYSQITGTVATVELSGNLTYVDPGLVPQALACQFIDTPVPLVDPETQTPSEVNRGIRGEIGSEAELVTHPDVIHYYDIKDLATLNSEWNQIENSFSLAQAQALAKPYWRNPFTFMTWPEYGVHAVQVDNVNYNNIPGFIGTTFFGNTFSSWRSKTPNLNAYNEIYLAWSFVIVDIKESAFPVKLPGMESTGSGIRRGAPFSGWFDLRVQHSMESPDNPGIVRFWPHYYYDGWKYSPNYQGSAQTTPLTDQYGLIGKVITIEQKLRKETTFDGATKLTGDGEIVMRIGGRTCHTLTGVNLTSLDAVEGLLNDMHHNIFAGGDGVEYGPMLYQIGPVVLATRWIGPLRKTSAYSSTPPGVYPAWRNAITSTDTPTIIAGTAFADSPGLNFTGGQLAYCGMSLQDDAGNAALWSVAAGGHAISPGSANGVYKLDLLRDAPQWMTVRADTYGARDVPMYSPSTGQTFLGSPPPGNYPTDVILFNVTPLGDPIGAHSYGSDFFINARGWAGRILNPNSEPIGAPQCAYTYSLVTGDYLRKPGTKGTFTGYSNPSTLFPNGDSRDAGFPVPSPSFLYANGGNIGATCMGLGKNPVTEDIWSWQGEHLGFWQQSTNKYVTVTNSTFWAASNYIQPVFDTTRGTAGVLMSVRPDFPPHGQMVSYDLGSSTPRLTPLVGDYARLLAGNGGYMPMVHDRINDKYWFAEYSSLDTSHIDVFKLDPANWPTSVSVQYMFTLPLGTEGPCTRFHWSERLRGVAYCPAGTLPCYFWATS